MEQFEKVEIRVKHIDEVNNGKIKFNNKHLVKKDQIFDTEVSHLAEEIFTEKGPELSHALGQQLIQMAMDDYFSAIAANYHDTIKNK